MDKDHDDTLRLFQLENEALKDKLRDSNSINADLTSQLKIAEARLEALADLKNELADAEDEDASRTDRAEGDVDIPGWVVAQVAGLERGEGDEMGSGEGDGEGSNADGSADEPPTWLVYDGEQSVWRCSDCLWEAADGECVHCGNDYREHEGEGYDPEHDQNEEADSDLALDPDRTTVARGSTPTLDVLSFLTPDLFDLDQSLSLEEFRALIARGATPDMIRLFDLRWSQEEGIVARMDEELIEAFPVFHAVADASDLCWKLHLGRTISLRPLDENGSLFVDQLVAELVDSYFDSHPRLPFYWKTQQLSAEPQVWATRRVGRNPEDQASTDNHVWLLEDGSSFNWSNDAPIQDYISDYGSTDAGSSDNESSQAGEERKEDEQEGVEQERDEEMRDGEGGAQDGAGASLPSDEESATSTKDDSMGAGDQDEGLAAPSRPAPAAAPSPTPSMLDEQGAPASQEGSPKDDADGDDEGSRSGVGDVDADQPMVDGSVGQEQDELHSVVSADGDESRSDSSSGSKEEEDDREPVLSPSAKSTTTATLSEDTENESPSKGIEDASASHPAAATSSSVTGSSKLNLHAIFGHGSDKNDEVEGSVVVPSSWAKSGSGSSKGRNKLLPSSTATAPDASSKNDKKVQFVEDDDQAMADDGQPLASGSGSTSLLASDDGGLEEMGPTRKRPRVTSQDV